MEIENFEDKLKNSNELFFKVFENNSIGLIFADLETTRYLYVNNSFLESTGYSKNELVGKTALELKLIEPIFRNENLAILRQQGELNNLETLINKKNGGVFWALTSVQIIILQDKKYALTSFIDITAQKKLEEQFSQLAAIVEFSEDAIFSTSLDGIIKNWNNGAEKIYGYSSKEAIGNHISMIIPSEFLNEEKEINKRILNNEIVKHYETVRINKKGEQLNISLSASPLKDGDGKIIGISVIARDITFKKKSEKELIDINAKFVLQTGEKEKRAAELVIADIELDFQNKEKEKREIVNKELEALSHSAKIASQYARSLIEASLDPLVTISVEGKITDVNEASVKVTGEKREKLIGTDFSDYFTEPERAREGYKQVFEKGFVSDYPLTIRHKNGKLTDVLYNASVYKDDKGNVLGVFAAARDVTDQKISEENLRKSLKEISDYKYALDEFSIVAITDQKGIIKHANDNFCKISKYTIDELIGQDHRIINSGYHPKEFIRDLWTTISSGNIWRGDLKNKAKDGTIYWVATTIVPFLDEQGKPYQYVSVRTDITDQKRFATELTEAKIFAELATGIAEEAQSKAESATRIAEDAMKAKQQFLSNMSHEIRTPMNAIIGFTKVVLKTDLLPKQKEYLQAIKVSGDALIVLINDILDLAKVDAGKMTFEQTPFKMASSISAMLHLFEPKIQEQNLILVKEYDINIPDVLVGDPVRLNQIVLNLVSNAVKFTTKGTITVSVKLLNEDEEKATIEFVVKDTGIGINCKTIGRATRR
jgi:PAS domain S-box-containing protein